MAAAKSMQVKADTYRRLRKLATVKKWTLSTTVDEASRALESKMQAELSSSPQPAGR